MLNHWIWELPQHLLEDEIINYNQRFEIVVPKSEKKSLFISKPIFIGELSGSPREPKHLANPIGFKSYEK